MNGQRLASTVRTERTYGGKPDSVVFTCGRCDGPVERTARYCQSCGIRLRGIERREETVK